MSLEARRWLVNHPATIFRSESQRDDLLDPGTTRTELIALLIELVNAGTFIEFCAVRSDHAPDNELGTHCHANGYCVDVWFNRSGKRGDYLDANDLAFAIPLRVARRSVWIHQIGLAGSADTQSNRLAAGPTVFSDDGADHVHLGAL